MKFKEIYQNLFIKNNFLNNSNLYNIFIKNNLFFYKNFNKIYLQKSIKEVTFFKYKRKKIKKNKFFKLRKQKDRINNIYLNVFKSLNKKKVLNREFYLNKHKLKLFLIFNYYLIDNLFFLKSNYKKINYNNFKHVFYCNYKNYNLFNFYKDLVFFNFYNNLNYNKNNLKFIIKNKNKQIKHIKNIKFLFFNYSLLLDSYFINKKYYSYKIIFVKLFYIFDLRSKKNIYYSFNNKLHKINNFDNFKKLIFSVFKNITCLNDFFSNNIIFKNNFMFSNFFFFKNLFILEENFNDSLNINNFERNKKNNLSLNFYNNYYPIFYSHKKSYKLFMSKFKSSLNLNYLIFTNYYVITFLEKLFKKRFFLKLSNNFFNKPSKQFVLNELYNDYKNFQPKYMKGFSLKDFFEIIWYSFFLKDLSLLTEWFCKFMESINFKFHKKFIIFFQNFIVKNQKIFFDFFNLRGFFFDIRGKVGVTGNSKKRHHFFKIGKINKSTKIRKINFKQSVVRTPSGVLGVTLIINY